MASRGRREEGGAGTHRPDVLTGGPQQLHDQVHLVDLGSAREKGLMGQQLSQDAAHRPAEECGVSSQLLGSAWTSPPAAGDGGWGQSWEVVIMG